VRVPDCSHTRLTTPSSLRQRCVRAKQRPRLLLSVAVLRRQAMLLLLLQQRRHRASVRLPVHMLAAAVVAAG
jgi:hypothetical protein